MALQWLQFKFKFNTVMSETSCCLIFLSYYPYHTPQTLFIKISLLINIYPNSSTHTRLSSSLLSRLNSASFHFLIISKPLCCWQFMTHTPLPNQKPLECCPAYSTWMCAVTPTINTCHSSAQRLLLSLYWSHLHGSPLSIQIRFPYKCFSGLDIVQF